MSKVITILGKIKGHILSITTDVNIKFCSAIWVLWFQRQSYVELVSKIPSHDLPFSIV